MGRTGHEDPGFCPSTAESDGLTHKKISLPDAEGLLTRPSNLSRLIPVAIHLDS